MSPKKRAECVRGAKLCFNCMKPGHYLRDCKAGSCKQCSGSQSSLITTRLCQDLRLQTSRIHMTIDAINGLSSEIKYKCKIELSTHHNSYKFCIECLVIPEITSQLPAQRINIPESEIPSNIKLADPSFNIPGKVDILIGADWFWNLLCVGQLTIGQNQLTLQKTKLGWVAVGPLKGIYSNSVRCNLSRSTDIDKQLMKFWEIEEVGHCKILYPMKKKSVRTIFQGLPIKDCNQDGRFVVTILFKKDPRELGESKTMALKRLFSLERRLQKDPILRERYVAFLE
ncbi:uncharacterized protein [Temnothorax longispinosus]|uniref:uncharacterized protein n=1 Tax=Temnothorax longispinosus TaxID=300112 RepID=UPI003A9986C7